MDLEKGTTMNLQKETFHLISVVKEQVGSVAFQLGWDANIIPKTCDFLQCRPGTDELESVVPGEDQVLLQKTDGSGDTVLVVTIAIRQFSLGEEGGCRYDLAIEARDYQGGVVPDTDHRVAKIAGDLLRAINQRLAPAA